MKRGKEGSVPENWERTNVGSLYEVIGGGTPSTSKADYWRGDIPWVTSADINGVRDINVSRHITPQAIRDSATNRVPERSLLVVTRVGLGKVAIASQSICFSQDLQGLVQNPDFILPEYSLYYLSFVLQRLKFEGRGTTISGITKKQLKDTVVPLPPFNEQRRIVAKLEELLSELDSALKNLNTAREQLKVYRQAVLKNAFEGKLTAHWREENKTTLESAERLLARLKSERETRYQQQLLDWKSAVKNWEENAQKGPMPTKPKRYQESRPIAPDEIANLPGIPDGWNYVRLADVAQIGSGMSVSESRTLVDPIQIPYLRVANVQRGRLDLDEITTMKIERSQLPRLELKHWDVLFNEGGDRDKLGRGWVWESQIQPCITQNHVFRASTYIPCETHAKFISYWGNTFGQAYFDRQGKQTTNLASINKTVLSAFPVPLPSFEEQAKILSELDTQITIIDKLELEIATALNRLEILRQSILKEAFSGQLVPQDPNDEPASVLLERIKVEKAKRSQGNKKSKRKAAA